MRTITTVNVAREPVRPKVVCGRIPGPTVRIAGRQAAAPALGSRIRFYERERFGRSAVSPTHRFYLTSAVGNPSGLQREWNKLAPPESGSFARRVPRPSRIRIAHLRVRYPIDKRLLVCSGRASEQIRSRAAGGGHQEMVVPPQGAVVIAIRNEMIARAEARRRYALSEEELAGWEVAFDRRGIPGLRSAFRCSLASPLQNPAGQPSFHDPG
jgi:hypothetical protein